MGSESHLLPVVSRLLEIEIPEDSLVFAEPVSYEDAEALQNGTLGDVNVHGIIAVVEAVPSLPFPPVSDEMSDADKASVSKRCTKSAEVLSDVLALAAIANRRFKKSATWPVAAVSAYLEKVGQGT